VFDSILFIFIIIHNTTVTSHPTLHITYVTQNALTSANTVDSGYSVLRVINMSLKVCGLS